MTRRSTDPPGPTAATPRARPVERTPEPRVRRALSGLTGGPIARGGEAALAELCAAALDVVAGEEGLPLTHGFHSYPARFHPEVPRRILAALPSARRVLDPFVGSGTTLVEAAVAGRAGLGTDVNTLAIVLARLKATPVGPARRQALRAAADEIAGEALAAGKAARRAGGPPQRSAAAATAGRPASAARALAFDDPAFYAPHVFRELTTLRLAIDARAPLVDRTARGPVAEDGRWLRDALLLTLSSIVIKVSRQRSDTDARLVDKTIGRGAPARLFAARATLLAEQLADFADRVPPGTPAPDLRRSDARRLRHVEDASIDLVVTSPPYLGTYDYAAHHERRFGWLGLDAEARSLLRTREIGPRRASDDPGAAAARWRGEVAAYVAEIARVLRPGGLAFLVVGDSVSGGSPVSGDAELRRAVEAGDRLGVAAWASQQRPPHPHLEHLLALRRG